MKCLQFLRDTGVFLPEDRLFFSFKTHVFECAISDEGLLWNCTHMQGGTTAACFMDRGGFDSLTDWADACLQEIAHEYVTRFSSWKRVRLKRTNQLVSEIRDQHHPQEAKTTRQVERVLRSYQKQNILLVQQNNVSKNILRQWASWIMAQDTCTDDLRHECAHVLRGVGPKNTALHVLSPMTRVPTTTPPHPLPVKPRAAKKRKRIPDAHAQDSIESLILSEDISDPAFNSLVASFFQHHTSKTKQTT